MGELAGLMTALCWAASATLFSDGSLRVGAGAVNRMRMLVGLVFLTLANWIIAGRPLPVNAGMERWFWLGTSGILGLAIGDGLMYYAYTLIGTRIAMLMTAFSPILSAVIAWLFLGETLGVGTILGIILTVSGVGVVVLERDEIGKARAGKRNYILGLGASLIAVITYATSMVMSKKGLEGDFLPLSGVVMRMSIAALAGWLPAMLMRQAGGIVRKSVNDRIALRDILLGSIIGPFAGIWFSFIAIQKTHVGVASTLISTSPVFLLPIAKWVQKEVVSSRAVLGTLLAIAGVAVIFLVK
jgi:drug/metabolite transporter (DMT)-like permease